MGYLRLVAQLQKTNPPEHRREVKRHGGIIKRQGADRIPSNGVAETKIHRFKDAMTLFHIPHLNYLHRRNRP